MPGLTEAQVQRYANWLEDQIREEMEERSRLKSVGEEDLAYNHKMFANAFTRAKYKLQHLRAHPEGDGA